MCISYLNDILNYSVSEMACGIDYRVGDVSEMLCCKGGNCHYISMMILNVNTQSIPTL